MTNFPLTLPYSQKDPEAILATIKSQITAKFPEWTDFLESDIGYEILKSTVALYDFNSFFTDQNVAETFLSECQLRESGVRRAKELNYVPNLSAPATCTALLSFPAFNTEVDIAANSVWSIGALSFTALDPIVIPQGQRTLPISLTQGSPYSVTVTAPGTPWYKITIPTNACGIQVKVNNVLWTETDSFLVVSTPTSYKIYEDTNGQTICFGANISTQQPTNGASITVTAILTQGNAGNIADLNQAVVPVTVIRDGNNVQINNAISGITTSAALGGQDPESLLSIQENAPAFYGTGGRAVTAKDYLSLVKQMSGVVDVKVVGGEDIGFYHYVYITVFGSNPYSVSPTLMTNIANALEQLNIASIIPIVQAPLIVELAMTINLGLVQNSFQDATVARNAVNNAVTSFFAPRGIGGQQSIGDNLYNSALSAAIQAIPGIAQVDINFTLDSFATSQAGVITIPIPRNADLTSCVLKNASNAVLFTGDGTSKITSTINTTNFNFVSNGLSDQVCTLTYKVKPLVNSQTYDVILNYNQINILSSLTVNAEFLS